MSHGITICSVRDPEIRPRHLLLERQPGSGKVDEKLETYEEIPSDNCPFNEKPAMKCAEITDHLIAAMESGKFGFLRCNFPNGDMVGHTGDFDAVVTSMEALDTQLGRIVKAAERLGYVLAVTADHGNADVMLEKNKKGQYQVRTAHSLSPVPFVIYGWKRRTPSGGLRPFPMLPPPWPSFWSCRCRKCGKRA